MQTRLRFSIVGDPHSEISLSVGSALGVAMNSALASVDLDDCANPVAVGSVTRLTTSGDIGTWLIKGSNLKFTGVVPCVLDLPMPEGQYEIVVDQPGRGYDPVDG